MLSFSSRFIDRLIGESSRIYGPHRVVGAHYSPIKPSPAPQPTLLHCNDRLLKAFVNENGHIDKTDLTAVLSGQKIAPGSRPYATAYGGHQFGYWAGQLGDGRAINLGELRDNEGTFWTWQLKGAGMTPYSRTADGLAVLRSSLREHIASEAMFALGIPTTRSLALILTGQKVMRDIYYDGNPRLESGAIVCRLSPNFIRFGHFELFAAREDLRNLKKLLEFVLQENFADLGKLWEKDPIRALAEWFDIVCSRTLDLIVQWQRVGFVHGVMNTDNMSILGETIDYGPYGWMDLYDPYWTPNITDRGGRYSFVNQPQIAFWNLGCLSRALVGLAGATEPLEAILLQHRKNYADKRIKMWRGKLGLMGERIQDKVLIDEFDDLLKGAQVDWTLFFIALAQLPTSSKRPWEELSAVMYNPKKQPPKLRQRFDDLIRRYFARIRLNDGDQARAEQGRQALMRQHNPSYIPRNYQIQQVIESVEIGDHSALTELYNKITHPYQEVDIKSLLGEMRPEWAVKTPSCTSLSCSS